MNSSESKTEDALLHITECVNVNAYSRTTFNTYNI